MKLSYIVSILMTTAVLLGSESIAAQHSASSSDVVNGVLSLMDDNIDFDSMLSGMGEGFDFDDMLSGMTRNPGQVSTKNPNHIEKTLDYLSSIYSEPLNGDNSLQSSAPVKYHYAGIGVLPVIGHITSNFGYRPAFKRMHHGIDISLQVGDTVRSAMDGTVSRVDVDPDGYGLFVVLSHRDGLETRYGHLSRSLVMTGMHIMAGDPIALGGNSGNSTGPHLHFETRRNNVAFDPATMFDFSMPQGMTRHRNLASLDGLNPKFGQRTNPNGSSYSAYGEAGMIVASDLAANNKTVSNIYSGAGSNKSTYVVKAGDTLPSVARQAGISVLSLCRLNMLSTTDILTPGRMLRLR